MSNAAPVFSSEFIGDFLIPVPNTDEPVKSSLKWSFIYLFDNSRLNNI